MAQSVKPKTYLVGYTCLDYKRLEQYLEETGQSEFLKDMEVYNNRTYAEYWMGTLCSVAAKLCYKSLVLGKNKNVTKIRSIEDNIKATIKSGHGSVLEHVSFNFITTNCSRVFTHELIRHRVGTAYSQSSGRYIREGVLKVVLDPILENVENDILDALDHIEAIHEALCQKLGLDSAENFATKKRLTDALRYMLPNGTANEIFWTMNIREFRHFVTLRTSRHASWEIRLIANQAYRLGKAKAPIFFYDAQEEHFEDLAEIVGMKLQPYQKEESSDNTN